MARTCVVVGDGLSNGGSVISGSPYTDIEGLPMARVGDKVLCAVHGAGSIITGDIALIIDGNAAARHGDRVSCGCQLVAGRQSLVFMEEGADGVAAASTPAPRKPTLDASPSPDHPPTRPDTRSSFRARRNSPACWAMDHEIEIATNAYGRYYVVYDEHGNRRRMSLQRRFAIFVPLKSAGNVEVLVRIKVVAARGEAEGDPVASGEDIANCKNRMEAGIQALWNNRLTLEISDPVCGARVFPILFKVEWVTTGHHYTMHVGATELRENVVNLQINVWKETSRWTFAHEFAHCIGVADEYSYDRVHTWTLKYYRPDGTLDHATIQLPVTKLHGDPSATIMSTQNNTIVDVRHAWQIALEVQAFLTRHTGRRIECSVS